MRRHTSWWRNRVVGGSAGRISRRRDDALPGGGTAPQEGQQGASRRGDETTHSLVAGQHRRRVSRVHFVEETRRRTLWCRNRAVEGSTGCISAVRRDDALPGGGTVPQKGQQSAFRQGDETTHELVAEQHRSRVSRVHFGRETRRRTSWWRNSAAVGSAGCISGRRRDDAHPGGGTGPWKGQQGAFRGGDETTHELVAEQRRGRVSRVHFGEETRRRTLWWR